MKAVRFLWGPKNRAHVLRHVSLAVAEGVALAGDLDLVEVGDGLTLKGYGTHAGISHFIVIQRSTDESEVYIVTCYPKPKKGQP